MKTNTRPPAAGQAAHLVPVPEFDFGGSHLPHLREWHKRFSKS